jgi:CHAD domain-containing protein
MKSPRIPQYARLRMASRLKRFLLYRSRAERSIHDAEAIHDLRVSIRRLQQSARTFRGLLAPAPARKMRKRLRKLMALCAAVRNCDVALTVLQQAGAESDQRKAELMSLRHEAELALEERLQDRRRWQKRKWLQTLRMETQSDAEWAVDQKIEDNLARILPALADGFFATGRIAAEKDDLESLHQFRLHAKRFRYTLELFRSFYGDQIKDCLQRLRELQDHLGGINDCVTTVSLLNDDHDTATAVHGLLREREARFKSYWRQYTARRQQAWKHWLSRPKAVV